MYAHARWLYSREPRAAFVCKMLLAGAVVFGALTGLSLQARAENSVSPLTTAELKPKDARTPARDARQSKTTAKVPNGAAAGPTPAYLSDAWVRNEKQADDRLKRMMNICKNC